MIRLALILFFLITTNCFGKTPTDSIRINCLESVYQKRTDSLQRELQYFKVKEDYYSDALGDQANRFSLIVGVLLTIAGLVSWGAVKYEVISLRKEFEGVIAAQIATNHMVKANNRDNYRRNNFSFALVLATMMQTNIFANKYYDSFLEAVLIIDMLTQVYDRDGDTEEKLSDIGRIKPILKHALSISRAIAKQELDSIQSHLMSAQEKTIMQMINDSISKVDDQDILEGLHEVKANFRLGLKK